MSGHSLLPWFSLAGGRLRQVGHVCTRCAAKFPGALTPPLRTCDGGAKVKKP